MMRRAWPDIVDSLKSHSRMLWMLVKGNVSVGGFDGQTLSLDFANEGARTTFANRNGEQAMNSAIQDVLGMQVRFKLQNGGTAAPGGGGGPKAESRLTPAPAPEQGPDDAPAWVQEEPPEPYDPGFYESAPEPPTETPAPHPAEHGATEDENTTSPVPPTPHPAWESAPSAESPDSNSPVAYKPEETKTPVPAFARRASAGPRTNAAPAQPDARNSPAPSHAPGSGPAAAGAESAPSRATQIRRRIAERRGGPTPVEHAQEPPADQNQPAPPPDPSWDSGPPSDYDQTAPPSWTQTPAAPAGPGAAKSPESKSPEPEDIASDDDVALEHSGVFVRKAFEKHLGATLLEERWLNE